MNAIAKGSLVVLSGFSGAGKGTVIRELLRRYEHFALSISATTRAKRPGERDGIDYFFTEKEAFRQMIAEGKLLEYAEFLGNFYGTPRSFVMEKLEEGKDVLLEIDVQGAMQVKRAFPDALLIFLIPPSAGELERRLRKRGTETEEQIRERLRQAIQESAGAEEYDYILVNEDIDSCCEKLHNLICASHEREDPHPAKPGTADPGSGEGQGCQDPALDAASVAASKALLSEIRKELQNRV